MPEPPQPPMLVQAIQSILVQVRVLVRVIRVVWTVLGPMVSQLPEATGILRTVRASLPMALPLVMVMRVIPRILPATSRRVRLKATNPSLCPRAWSWRARRCRASRRSPRATT